MIEAIAFALWFVALCVLSWMIGMILNYLYLRLRYGIT